MNNEQDKKGFGVASLVLSIVGMFLFQIILQPLAVVFGIIAIKTNGKTGRALGIAGLCVSAFFVLIGALFLTLLVVLPNA